MSHKGSTKYKEYEGDLNLLPIIHNISILTTRPRHHWLNLVVCESLSNFNL